MEIILFILTGFLLGWFILKPLKDSIVKSYEKELTELKKEIIELKKEKMEIDFKKIELENEIIKTLNKYNTKNNTFHFIFKDNELNIISCNPNTKQIFLLIENSGDNVIDCLNKALDDIQKENAEEYSWIVKWIDDVNNEHVSYFRGKNETEVRNKFYYSDDRNIAIVDIKKMPLS